VITFTGFEDYTNAALADAMEAQSWQSNANYEAAKRLRQLDQDEQGKGLPDMEVSTAFTDSELLVIGMGLSWVFGYIAPDEGEERPMPSGVASNFNGLIQAIDRAKKRALSNAD
jgi:hypothetical protein